MSLIAYQKRAGAIIVMAGFLCFSFGITLEICHSVFEIPFHSGLTWKVHLASVLGLPLFLWGDFWLERFRNFGALFLYLCTFTFFFSRFLMALE